MKIEEQIKNCSLCGQLPKIYETPIQLGTSPFIIIGESPAKDGWIISKKAFYNSKQQLQGTGRVLNKLLNIIGYSINDIYFTECCKCVIENRKLLAQCSKNCMPILKQQLKSVPCEIIITMGLHPTQAILQTKIKKFADVVGKILNINFEGKSCVLIPIYHPSPLNPKGYKDNLPIFENLKKLIELKQN